MTTTQRASARTHSRAHKPLEEIAISDDCRKPSRLLPITLEFMLFESRCRALGFERSEILKLAKALAEKDLADGK
ncbi:hypothetical protein [Mesorhizobium sp.]|uniref:hypothetical protein n=1 Tax=Mesorhizobium sp. TaxID=1871066 RepID=UPI00120A8453|nr:hypothetical protein [Mesorhizobium sp.]TIO04563.1 MAG: hypothetical protein E5X88_31130 [Mesorhizobium sp.]TIO29344.1 MAG: hypothetical protein E5X89_31275 [Mesorhizobium sp.]